MNKSPRLLVFKLKELIYTFLFIVLAIIFIAVLIIMFNTNKKPPTASAGEVNNSVEKPSDNILKEESNTNVRYKSGTYTTDLILSGSTLTVEVKVSSDSIKSVSLKNTDDTIKTLYPLIESSMENLSNQIIKNQSLDNITYNDDNKYTSLILMDAIKTTLEKAVR